LFEAQDKGKGTIFYAEVVSPWEKQKRSADNGGFSRKRATVCRTGEAVAVAGKPARRRKGGAAESFRTDKRREKVIILDQERSRVEEKPRAVSTSSRGPQHGGGVIIPAKRKKWRREGQRGCSNGVRAPPKKKGEREEIARDENQASKTRGIGG